MWTEIQSNKNIKWRWQGLWNSLKSPCQDDCRDYFRAPDASGHAGLPVHQKVPPQLRLFVYTPTYTHKPIQLKMYLLSALVCLAISHLSWVGGTNLCSIYHRWSRTYYRLSDYLFIIINSQLLIVVFNCFWMTSMISSPASRAPPPCWKCLRQTPNPSSTCWRFRGTQGKPKLKPNTLQSWKCPVFYMQVNHGKPW